MAQGGGSTEQQQTGGFPTNRPHLSLQPTSGSHITSSLLIWATTGLPLRPWPQPHLPRWWMPIMPTFSSTPGTPSRPRSAPTAVTLVPGSPSNVLHWIQHQRRGKPPPQFFSCTREEVVEKGWRERGSRR